ncbi:MAG: NAD(P)-dependent oxidoreductase [Pseudomonadota bacterium]
MILVTGSSGLIGTALEGFFAARGQEWRAFDIANSAEQDTRDPVALARAMDGVEGIIHLAAVSRVVWAQNDPETCQAVNVDALETTLKLALEQPRTPWMIFASSREVYGEQTRLPVHEDASLSPLNTYARSKGRGEELVQEARKAGMLAQIVRFSNVYGSVEDHHDRVVPAFARTAAHGGVIRVDGSGNTFDFTHVSDSARGLDLLCQATQAGEAMPPVHFVTGEPTTLGELAQMAADRSNHSVKLTEAPSRNFDVSRFYGDTSRTRELLGWQPEVALAEGFAKLVTDFESTDTKVFYPEGSAPEKVAQA